MAFDVTNRLQQLQDQLGNISQRYSWVPTPASNSESMAANLQSNASSQNMYNAMNRRNILQEMQALNQMKLYDPSYWSSFFGGAPASSSTDTSGYGAKLQSLMDNPDSIASSGAYKFRLGQGNQAIQRSAAAKGMLGSGNTLAELLRYGQGEASQEYGNEVGRLTTLRGQDLGLQAQREKAALDAKNMFAQGMMNQLFEQASTTRKNLNAPSNVTFY